MTNALGKQLRFISKIPLEQTLHLARLSRIVTIGLFNGIRFENKNASSVYIISVIWHCLHYLVILRCECNSRECIQTIFIDICLKLDDDSCD